MVLSVNFSHLAFSILRYCLSMHNLSGFFSKLWKTVESDHRFSSSIGGAHIALILHSPNEMHCIYWFTSVKHFLYLRDESHLIIMYGLFRSAVGFCSQVFCWHFLTSLFTSESYCVVFLFSFFLFVVSLPGFNIRVMLSLSRQFNRVLSFGGWAGGRGGFRRIEQLVPFILLESF